jgi:hypothetical protein
MNEWLLLDWSDLTLGGDEDDDPTEPDEDSSATEVADESEESVDAEEAGAQTEATAAKSEEKAAESAKPAERVYTQAELQAELDRVAGQRAARERAAIERKVLEATGKPLEALLAEQKAARIQALQETHLMTPEQAQAQVAQEEELARLRAERAELEAERQMAVYERSKAAITSHPHFKALEAEVDTLTGNGTAGLTAEDAFHYLLGKKLASGELQASLTKTAEQKAIRQMQKAAKAAPVSAGAGAGTGGHGLNAAQLQAAKRLRLTPQEYAAGLNNTDDE